MVNRDMSRNGSWDLKEVDSLPQSPCVDQFNLWPDGSCRYVYSGEGQQAVRHCSGWAMRNTNNHNVAILKKSCLGVLICNRRCYRATTGDVVSVRPAICDKARRKQIGKPCPNPDCAGALVLQPCRGHGGYPVTHFWRHANSRIYFMAKGKHDHQRPELKISSDKTRTYTKTEGTTRRKRQHALKLLASNDDHPICSCPPFECLCGSSSSSAAVAATAATSLGSIVSGHHGYESKSAFLGSTCQPHELSPFASSMPLQLNGGGGAYCHPQQQRSAGFSYSGGLLAPSVHDGGVLLPPPPPLRHLPYEQVMSQRSGSYTTADGLGCFLQASSALPVVRYINGSNEESDEITGYGLDADIYDARQQQIHQQQLQHRRQQQQQQQMSPLQLALAPARSLAYHQQHLDSHHHHSFRRYHHQQLSPLHDMPGLSVPRLVPPMLEARTGPQVCIDYAPAATANAVDLTTPKFEYSSNTLAESDLPCSTLQTSGHVQSASGSPSARAEDAQSADGSDTHGATSSTAYQHHMTAAAPANTRPSSPSVMAMEEHNAGETSLDFEMNGIQDILDLENFQMFTIANNLSHRRTPPLSSSATLPGLSAFFDKGASTVQKQMPPSPPPLRSDSPPPTYMNLQTRDRHSASQAGGCYTLASTSPSLLTTIPRSLPNFATVFQPNTPVKM